MYYTYFGEHLCILVIRSYSCMCSKVGCVGGGRGGHAHHAPRCDSTLLFSVCCANLHPLLIVALLLQARADWT